MLYIFCLPNPQNQKKEKCKIQNVIQLHKFSSDILSFSTHKSQNKEMFDELHVQCEQEFCSYFYIFKNYQTIASVNLYKYEITVPL